MVLASTTLPPCFLALRFGLYEAGERNLPERRLDRGAIAPCLISGGQGISEEATIIPIYCRFQRKKNNPLSRVGGSSEKKRPADCGCPDFIAQLEEAVSDLCRTHRFV